MHLGLEILSTFSQGFWVFEAYFVRKSFLIKKACIEVEGNGVTWCKSSVKFKKKFKVNKSLNPLKNLRISSALQEFILETSLITLRSLKRPTS